MLNTDRLCLGCMNDSGEAKVCPFCGYDAETKNPEDTLPTKFWINDRYLVGKVIYSNGEAISYIGWDNQENSIVVIKEYFPLGAAHRNPDKTVSIVEGKEYTFNEGLLSFKEINEILRDNEIACIIPVNAVFEENGTIYAIFPNIPAIPLREFLTKNGGTLDWEQAKLLFVPLVEAVSKVNALGIIHRGISPETILVGKDGKLHLAGFAVRNLRFANNDFTTQLYPGYAAAEQYNIDGFEEGSHTDVYALCAILFRTLIGTVPPEATSRLNNDSMTIPARFAEAIPRNVLASLANGLQVNPKERTANAEILKTALTTADPQETVVHTSVEDTYSSNSKKKKNDKKQKKSGSTAKYVIISALCTALVFAAVFAALAGTVFKDVFFPESAATSSPTESYSEAPSVDQIGSYDSEAVESVKLYSVPNVLGKYYSDIEELQKEDELYEKFIFIIKDKEYSDKYPKGTICSQSVKAGEEVQKETEIKVVISLGPKEIKIANVVGLTPDAAKLELLKQGFLYDNIVIEEMYNSEEEPGTILEQEPKFGSSVNTEVGVKLFINTYTGSAEEDSQSSDIDTAMSDVTNATTIPVQ